MSKIDELIAELCPDGVEYKAIKDVALIRGGHTPSKAKRENYEGGTIPWITSKDVKKADLWGSGICITEAGAKSLNLYPVGTIVVVVRSGILKRYLPVAQLRVPATVNQDIKAVNPKDSSLSSRFLYYCIHANARRLLDIGHRAGGTVDSVPMKAFESMEIPVPPMEIQQEIVRILDSFAELEAELEARRAQYAYYRDKLLDFTERESPSRG